jgi:hypothetical protein
MLGELRLSFDVLGEMPTVSEACVLKRPILKRIKPV